MFTIDGIRKLHSWTHASMALVLDHLSSLPTAAYTQEVAGFGFSTLSAQVVHVFNCEGFWVHTLQSRSFTDRRPGDVPTVSSARELQQQVMEHTLAYLSHLSEEQLNTSTKLHFSDGEEAAGTPALVLHHLLTHAFHHKGQIVAMCRLLGYPAPGTDLNRFQ